MTEDAEATARGSVLVASRERRALEAQFRQRRRKLDEALANGVRPWLAKTWARAAMATSALAFPFAWVTGTPADVLFDPSRLPLWAALGTGPILATVATVFAWRGARRERGRSLDEAVRQAVDERAKLRSQGWLGRTLGTGVLMGLGVGLPVGLLMAVGWPASKHPAGSPALGVVQFVGMTMCWTLPMAFLIRWLYLRPMSERTAPPSD